MTPRLTIDYRRTRSDVLTAAVMQEIEHFIDIENRRDVHDALTKLFWRQGVEIITDADRARAGLRPRGNDGLTADELMVLEQARLNAMLRFPDPIIKAAP